MNKRVRRVIEMGDRVVEIGKDPTLSPFPGITALFAQASALVTSLKERGSDQATGSSVFRGGALQCRVQANDIRAAMSEISGIAKVLKAVDLPGASEIFRLPRGTVSYQSLLALARHFAETVEPHKALFITRALPVTFVADLEARIAAFESAIARKANGRATRIEGTSGMQIDAKALLGVVNELRAVLRVHLKANPALLDAFKSAARVERNQPSQAAAVPVPTGGNEAVIAEKEVPQSRE